MVLTFCINNMSDNAPQKPNTELSNLAFVLIPRFNMMTLTTTIEPIRIANYLSPEPLYRWHYLSFDGEDIIASNGMSVHSELVEVGSSADYDAVFIIGSWGCEHYVCDQMFSWLQRLNRNNVKICGMEMGIYPLARAKILSKKLVTTHWSMMMGFAEQFPKANLKEQLFTEDGNLISCSGGTAGIDMMLHLIAAAHGDFLASEITDQMMHYPIRPASAPQRHTHGSPSESIHPYVDQAIKLLESNIMDPLKVPEIANRIGISQRQLERYFKRYLGCSVVQYSQLLRLQYARVLLTSTQITIREVSVASGFNSMSHFANAFINCFGKKPSDYRNAWPDTEAAPSWPGTVFSIGQQHLASIGKPRKI